MIFSPAHMNTFLLPLALILKKLLNFWNINGLYSGFYNLFIYLWLFNDALNMSQNIASNE